MLVTGTPYVDVWQAVRPAAVGIEAWPVIPKGQDWKTGICRALGVEDPRVMWRRILDSVHDWKQLEQPFVAAVEQLIDFVTAALDPTPDAQPTSTGHLGDRAVADLVGAQHRFAVLQAHDHVPPAGSTDCRTSVGDGYASVCVCECHTPMIS